MHPDEYTKCSGPGHRRCWGRFVVQGTHICALAILVESYLSFLGAGTPPHIPSWGNIMAEGRAYVQIGAWIILFPGLFLMLTVLSINLIGDGLRDLLKV
jgi:peptide/nickel transport system permease protein